MVAARVKRDRTTAPAEDRQPGASRHRQEGLGRVSLCLAIAAIFGLLAKLVAPSLPGVRRRLWCESFEGGDG